MTVTVDLCKYKQTHIRSSELDMPVPRTSCNSISAKDSDGKEFYWGIAANSDDNSDVRLVQVQQSAAITHCCSSLLSYQSIADQTSDGQH